jgi:hypothetical protein
MKYDLVAMVFVRETSDALTSLVRKLDEQLERSAGKRPIPEGVFIIFDNQTPGFDVQLREMAARAGLKRVSLCIGTAPKNYEVSPDADLTAVVYRLGKRRGEPVTANFALRRGELDAAKADAIVKSLADQLPR